MKCKRPSDARTWESETFPAIRAQAKKEDATIYFADINDYQSSF